MLLYCMFDRVAVATMPIFEAKNDEIAMRSYQGMLEQPEFRCYADSIDLLRVGKLDNETGIITEVETPPVVVDVSHLLRASFEEDR